MNESDIDYCLEVRNACLQIHPRLMNLNPGSDVEPGFTVINYSTDIEAEVDGIYKQMYDEHTTIDEVIALLQRSKASTNPRDHEIFSCMLHFLFDEYKFFQSYYPARELAMTAYLFGSLIQHQLVEYIPLGIAIRYVIDALNCPSETNLFKFGVQALSRFESRLAEWQPLCQALLRIPHLAEARPDLIAGIHRILSASNGSGNADPSAAVNAEAPPVFTAIQPDKIEEPMEIPPEDVSDKILFIVNNLAPSNYESKVAEMRDQFRDQHARWFANYLVDQRISTEPNNHALYLRFLDSLEMNVLSKLVLQETLVKATSLLNSEKTMQSSPERATLKNIGSWLGIITLARDRPIKHKNLSFKDLLIEGYDSGRLIVAIPFVCKTLEPCAQSKVFKPPNPWLMAVISLLAELYHFAELRLNLKFEIEVLCKGLELDLDAVEATSILRNRPLNDSLGGPGLPEYVSDIDSLHIGGYDPATRHLSQDPQVLSLVSSSPSESQRVLGGHFEAMLSNLLQHITINPQLGTLATNQTFKQAVQVAVHRAVREVKTDPIALTHTYEFAIQIIAPVVERSVTIARVSTRELVVKDFVTESDEEKLRKASHLMARKLAGSLALVTGKEPLKSRLPTHLRESLGEQGFYEVCFFCFFFPSILARSLTTFSATRPGPGSHDPSSRQSGCCLFCD
jgi:CCR4-NOT transcription complex subunit 1